MGLVNHVFTEDNLKKLYTSNLGIGHTRYATTGNCELENCQPFVVETLHGKIAVAHNGELVNAARLRRKVRVVCLFNAFFMIVINYWKEVWRVLVECTILLLPPVTELQRTTVTESPGVLVLITNSKIFPPESGVGMRSLNLQGHVPLGWFWCICFGMVIWEVDLIIPRTVSSRLLRLWHCRCNNTVFLLPREDNFFIQSKI